MKNDEKEQEKSPNDQNRTGDQLISEDTENGINHYSQSLYHLSYARIRHLPHTMHYKYKYTNTHTNNLHRTTTAAIQSPHSDDTYNTHSTHTKIRRTASHFYSHTPSPVSPSGYPSDAGITSAQSGTVCSTTSSSSSLQSNHSDENL